MMRQDYDQATKPSEQKDAQTSKQPDSKPARRRQPKKRPTVATVGDAERRKVTLYLDATAEEALHMEMMRRRREGTQRNAATLSVIASEAILRCYAPE